MKEEDRAFARNTDPYTSHEAAESVNVTRCRRIVMEIFENYVNGPVTHEQLCDLAHTYEYDITDQGVRSRCSELVKKGVVLYVDRKGVTVSGNASRRWALA